MGWFNDAGSKLPLSLDGGALVITVSAETWEVTRTGPARRSFVGTAG